MDSSSVLSPQESFVSMRELDPSPEDDTPYEVQEKEYFPTGTRTSSLPKHSTGSTLGLSGHSTTWWLTRVQKYSAYTFSAFLTAHIVNTSIIPLATQSVVASEKYLLLTRPYYQSPIFEPLIVVAPLALHILSGISLRLYRRRQSVNWYGAESRADKRKLAWPKLSGTSLLGYILLPAITAHVYVNRILPLIVEGGSSGVGLSYIAHGFARHPALAYTAYAGLICLGVSHIVWGWAKYLGLSPDTMTGVNGAERQTAKKRRWYAVNGAVLTGVLLWAAGGLGIVARGGAAIGYKAKGMDNLFHQIPLLGGWLA